MGLLCLAETQRRVESQTGVSLEDLEERRAGNRAEVLRTCRAVAEEFMRQNALLAGI